MARNIINFKAIGEGILSGFHIAIMNVFLTRASTCFPE
jgi:hypothetical protein